MNTFPETREYGSDFPVSSFYATDINFLAHWHIDVEMVFVCEGRIQIGVNKETKVMGPEEIAVFSSTDIHYYHSGDMHSKIIILQFRPELVGSPGGWPKDLRFASAFINLHKFDKPIREEIIAIFHAVAAEMNETKPFSRIDNNDRIITIPNQNNEKKPYYRPYVNGRLLELCALALRHFPANSMNPTEKNHQLPDIRKIQSAIQYLEKNYMHDISLGEIANKSNFSPYHFSRLFHQFTGITFHNYLNRVRIAKAEQLIIANQKSLIDISFECGFNSVRTFNRTFKAVKGFPPSKLKASWT